MSTTIQFLVFSDLHAHNYTRYAKINKPDQNSRLKHIIGVLAYIREYALHNNIYDVLFVGDMFEAKYKTPITVLNAVYRELKIWEKVGIRLLAIPGNHDYITRNGLYHILETLESLDNIVIVENVSNFEYRLASNQSVYIVAVPFAENFEQQNFTISCENIEIPKICLAHGIPENAFLNKKYKVKNQEEDHEGLCLNIIPYNWLNSFDLVIIGHIHYSQFIDQKILIPGQPYHLHAYEWDQNRGFWHVKLTKTSTKYMVDVQLIEAKAPKFCFWKLNKEGQVYVDDEYLNCNTEYENNIHIIKMLNFDLDHQILSNIVEYYYNNGAAYVDILPIHKIDEKYQPRIQINPHGNPIEIVQQVLESGLIDLKGFTVEELVMTSKEILQDIS